MLLHLLCTSNGLDEFFMLSTPIAFFICSFGGWFLLYHFCTFLYVCFSFGTLICWIQFKIYLFSCANIFKCQKFCTWTRCFVASKILRFLVVVFLQIDSCFWIRSLLKFRLHIGHVDIPSGAGPADIFA